MIRRYARTASMKAEAKRFLVAIGLGLVLGAAALSGARAQVVSTELVSKNSAGEQAVAFFSFGSESPVISDNGRFVVFTSHAANLIDLDGDGEIDPDGNGDFTADVFVHDRVTGITEIVSVNDAGEQGNGGSIAGSVSADGRYVMFNSTSSNLYPFSTGIFNVFVRDRVLKTTDIVSVNNFHQSGNSTSISIAFRSMTPDGRFVAFASNATNLIDNDQNGSNYDVFVRDLQEGTTEIVNLNSNGVQAATCFGLNCETSLFSLPTISDDGNLVAFASQATNLVDIDGDGVIDLDSNGNELDVFVRDREAGTTEIISVNSAGEQANLGTNVSDSWPSISADGHFVAFVSSATNLIDNDQNGEVTDVFVRNRVAGTTEIVSLDNAGGQQLIFGSRIPSISADGRFVAFISLDVLVRDRVVGSTKTADLNNVGEPANGFSQIATISADGTLVAFDSSANNLIDADGDGVFDDDLNGFAFDVFVADLGPVPNLPPVANAGPDQTVEATSATGAGVTLDGSGSSDADGGTLTYAWSGPFGTASGVAPTVTVPLGTHIITLTVDDGTDTDMDTVQITVQDTTPPVLTVPNNLFVTATGLETPVDIGTASATDLFWPVEITNDAPALFPLDETIVTWTATDANGNVATAIQKITVRFGFIGFLSPLNNLPAINLINSGGVVELSWQISDGQGGFFRNLEFVESVRVVAVACDDPNNEPIGNTDDVATVGKSDLLYDTRTERYVVKWKTNGAVDDCAVVIVSLIDGSDHLVKFQVK